MWRRSIEGQPVRLSEDYFIATDKAKPPEIAIDRPGGDYRASPIEEVTVGVKAADQFGLNDVHLHYSVNGGPEQTVNLLEDSRARRMRTARHAAAGRFQAGAGRPGEPVCDGEGWSRRGAHGDQLYPGRSVRARVLAVAAEGGGGGGGGGGQNNQTDISKREKELIAATWKQQNDKTATREGCGGGGQVPLRCAAEAAGSGDGAFGAHAEP